MTDALALLDRVGATIREMRGGDEPEPEYREPKFTDVSDGPELHRVLMLPRRAAPAAGGAEWADLAQFLTNRFATTPTPYPGTLRVLQAAALFEAHECGGLAGFIRVGGGKMLTSLLIAAVMRSPRALYVCPASMRPDTLAEFEKYRQSWVTPGPAQFPLVTYEKLANPSSGVEFNSDGSVARAALLDQIQPTLLVFDEAHVMGSTSNVVTKRVRKYLKDHPTTVVVVLTGSPFSTSIRDAAHLLEWSLGERSPLPRPSCGWAELEQWASYLDLPRGLGPQTGVGALVRFLDADERGEFERCLDGDQKRRIVRRAVARRLFETPGLLTSLDGRLVNETGTEIGLNIHTMECQRPTDAVDAFFLTLRGDRVLAARQGAERDRGGAGELTYPGWRLPDGTELEDGLAFHKHATTAGYGFWQVNDPPVPQWFRAARNGWAVWCREAIKHNRRGIDSASRMADAVRKGLYDDEGTLSQWTAARAQYKDETGLDEPPTTAYWLSDEAIETVATWVAEHHGVVWVQYIPLGQRLADVLKIPYYAKRGLDAKTRTHITKHPGGPAVISLQSNKVGRNLQGFWSKNLWLAPMSEQALARTHRPGQQAAAVDNWLYLGCAEHVAGFARARDLKAEFHEDMSGTAQKLVYATASVPTVAQLSERESIRWHLTPKLRG